MEFKIPKITAKTKILAVIGDPIEHSMSPTMHNAAIEELNLDYVYVAFHVKSNNLEWACYGFRALDIKGINVTIPHKVEIMKYLNEIDPIAKGIGAINTIKNEDGKLIGKNTDAEGFMKSLEDAGFNPSGKKCLILGCGGAARAISFILAIKAKQIIITDIVPEVMNNLYKNLNEFYSNEEFKESIGIKNTPTFKKIPLNQQALELELKDLDLLVNATPIGMHPNSNSSPLDGLNITLNSNIFVFDAVYNPIKTKLMKDAEKLGCKTLSGIDMLVNQGALAFEWWTGYKPNNKLMKEAAIKKLNIIK